MSTDYTPANYGDGMAADLYREWPIPSRPIPEWWVYPPRPPVTFPKATVAYEDLVRRVRSAA